MIVEELKQLTVLYVEDDTSVSTAMRSFFTLKVKKVYFANDGLEGLDLFLSHKDDIDVVVTDIQMPKMDGLEMISHIRDQNPHIRTIITTAFDDSKYLMKSIQLGVNAYLMKPLDLRKLSQALKEQFAIIKCEKNDTLFQSALSLALEMHDNPSFALVENKIISVNSLFLSIFKIPHLEALPLKQGELLVDAVINSHSYIEINDIRYDVAFEIDVAKRVNIVSLAPSPSDL